MAIIDKIKQAIFNANEKGIPVPLARSPETDQPSVTLTMMLIAFGLAVLSLVGKFSGALGNIDISGANYLFLTTAGLYLGRKVSSNNETKTVEVEKDVDAKKN